MERTVQLMARFITTSGAGIYDNYSISLTCRLRFNTCRAADKIMDMQSHVNLSIFACWNWMNNNIVSFSFFFFFFFFLKEIFNDFVQCMCCWTSAAVYVVVSSKHSKKVYRIITVLHHVCERLKCFIILMLYMLLRVLKFSTVFTWQVNAIR